MPLGQVRKLFSYHGLHFDTGARSHPFARLNCESARILRFVCALGAIIQMITESRPGATGRGFEVNTPERRFILSG